MTRGIMNDPAESTFHHINARGSNPFAPSGAPDFKSSAFAFPFVSETLSGKKRSYGSSASPSNSSFVMDLILKRKGGCQMETGARLMNLPARRVENGNQFHYHGLPGLSRSNGENALASTRCKEEHSPALHRA